MKEKNSRWLQSKILGYNNPIIKQYIERYIEANALPDPYDVTESLREELRTKDNMVERMAQRDATLSKYKAQNKELTDEAASLLATIKSQEALIHQLRVERHTSQK